MNNFDYIYDKLSFSLIYLFCNIMVVFVFLIMIGLVLLPWLQKKKKINCRFSDVFGQFVLSSIISIPTIIVIFIILGIMIAPLIIMLEYFPSGIILTAFIIMLMWSIILLIVKLRNNVVITFNDEESIYVRDINVSYSPAVLSFLINNRIEEKKDLPATLLNLCVKDILKIANNEDGTLKIIDLKNKKAVENLCLDEKYAYRMFVEGITSKKIVEWKNIIKREYKKYKFSNENKMRIFKFLIITLIGVVLTKPRISVFYINYTKIFPYIFTALWVALCVTAIMSRIERLIDIYLGRDKQNEFKDMYSKKGAIEINRWRKFEKFIKDYTLISEKKYESINTLGSYLSYSIVLGINKNCDKEIYRQINKKYLFDINKIKKMFTINDEIS